MELKPPTNTAKAPESNFVGDVYVTPIITPTAPSRLAASLVRFTPEAANQIMADGPAVGRPRGRFGLPVAYG
jgi:hypothetical protein